MFNKSSGFTLIELLVVVLIIGILAAVAVPQYQKAVEKARLIKYFSYLKTISEAHEAYCMANNTFAPDIRDLDIDLSGISEYKQASYTTNTIISAYFPDGSDCGPTYDHSAGCIVRKNGNGEFWIYKKGDTFQCGGFTQKASDVCKTISDGNAPASWSASSNGLYTVKF